MDKKLANTLYYGKLILMFPHTIICAGRSYLRLTVTGGYSMLDLLATQIQVKSRFEGTNNHFSDPSRHRLESSSCSCGEGIWQWNPTNRLDPWSAVEPLEKCGCHSFFTEDTEVKKRIIMKSTGSATCFLILVTSLHLGSWLDPFEGSSGSGLGLSLRSNCWKVSTISDVYSRSDQSTKYIVTSSNHAVTCGDCKEQL